MQQCPKDIRLHVVDGDMLRRRLPHRPTQLRPQHRRPRREQELVRDERLAADDESDICALSRFQQLCKVLRDVGRRRRLEPARERVPGEHAWFLDDGDVAVDGEAVVVEVGGRLELGGVHEGRRRRLREVHAAVAVPELPRLRCPVEGRRQPGGVVDQAEVAGGQYLGALAHES